MTTAPKLGGYLRHPLYLLLAGYLTRLGVTITHAPGRHLDGTWCAKTRTLTLRADASDEDHIAVLGDLIRMTTLHEPSGRGAYPHLRPRHLHALPTPV